ncbi:MAG TPA: hypothetical protein VFZ09_06930 [Archangium sp.]|uniref:hypothetical protein n=1 Tax=Archangium sp. TaxID=1872627 RepID=UPI002E345AA6|nr:hypothetical protein [Archangium sp.]HEX5745959.1 hypothetical protein [Archangium sp.]
MFRMPKQHWKRSALVVCGALFGLAPLVYAQDPSEEDPQGREVRARPEGNVHTSSERQAKRSMPKAALVGNQLFLSCMLDFPSQVRRFAVTCPGTRHIDVKLADCCDAGDHWQVTVRSWDPKPNVAVASASGANGEFSMPARVFTYHRTRDMNALIECSYLHGRNLFPAEADILVETPGAPCTVRELGFSSEADLGR